MFKTPHILIFSIFLIGCDQLQSSGEVKKITATACSKIISNGKSVDCELDEESENQLDSFQKQYLEIDNESPGPIGPDIFNIDEKSLFDVKAINGDNSIILESGDELILAGIKCKSKQAYQFLSKTLISETSKTRIWVKNIGLNSDGQNSAYVWKIEWYEDYADFGPSLSSVNEILITSGNCVPVEQKNHEYNERYKKLAELVVL